MKRVYVNEEWCLACHLCEYNCAFANSGMKDMVKALKGKQIHPRIMVEEADEGRKHISFAVSCRHCEEPLCLKSCITGALHLEDGVICCDSEKCVGCYTCILSCPYGCIQAAENGQVVQKCELCAKNSDGSPACVKGCPNRAIVFEERGVPGFHGEGGN
ncbi:MAG: 4Fe-4S binding protein [Treponemataceae bacterium]|nr:4Fe-4S binding protein [Treponemataceae bacterium]